YNRLDERSLVGLTNDAAVHKDSLVENRAGARERTSQAQEEWRPVVRKQNVDVDQFVSGARQNPGHAELPRSFRPRSTVEARTPASTAISTNLADRFRRRPTTPSTSLRFRVPYPLTI